MNRSELVARIATAERQLTFLREELEKEDKHRYYLEEKRSCFDGRLKAAIIRDRGTLYNRTTTNRARPIQHFPVATVDRVGNMTEEEVLEAGTRLLKMYRSSER